MPLHFQQVDFAYRRARPVLRGVTLRVEPGQFTALLGPNGAGKSTLLRLALGVLAPSAGTVTLDGAPVAALPERTRAPRLAYAPQSPALASAFTVRQFVALGRYALADDHAAVDRALERTDLADRAAEPFHALSAGQQQRAALARVLAQLDGPPPGPGASATRVLLADEPFAAMDPRHMLRCVNLLRALAASGVAVLCAMHDLTVALRFSTYAAILDESGRLAAAGLTADVLTPPILSKVYGVGFDRIGQGRSAAVAVSADTIG